jgi:hypothetical protein
MQLWLYGLFWLGRMWCIRFHIITEEGASNRRRPGAWAVSLSILEHSPPTWIDSRLIIRDLSGRPRQLPSPSLPSPKNLLRNGSSAISTFMDTISGLSTNSQFVGSHSNSLLFVTLRTGHEQLFPTKLDRRKKRDKQSELTAFFDDCPLGQNLQYP